MHYIYKITIILNSKIYIGQTQNLSKRWSQHKAEALKDKPSMTINDAMKKYGVDNCKIEIIDFAQNYWQADCLEQNYIKQYESHISGGKGYNVSLGGPVAPKSEEWKKIISQKAQERAPKTSEQMRNIAANRSEDYYDHFKGNQHAAGIPHTDEWKEMMSNRVHSEEERLKRAKSLKKAYAEGRRVSATKIKWTEEQIIKIKSDTRSSYKISEEYGVSSRTIRRIRNQ